MLEKLLKRIIFASMIAAISCTGPVGPKGDTGVEGPQGEQGIPGVGEGGFGENYRRVDPKVLNIALSTTVALVGDGGPYCTGVWVASDRILTANHCISALGLNAEVMYSTPDPASTPHMFGPAGEKGSATVLWMSPQRDLALLEASPQMLAHGVAVVAPTEPEQGDSALILGNQGGFYFNLMDAIVSAVRHDSPVDWVQAPFVQVYAAVWYGNSGGPLFDSQGRVIGICSFITEVPTMGFYIAPTSINGFLSGN